MNENKKGVLRRAADIPKRKLLSFKEKALGFKALSKEEKLLKTRNFALDNAMFIIILTAIIVIAILQPRFLSAPSIINIISLTAAKLPIAIGIGGAIVLSGTDISAGRAVGLTATVAKAPRVMLRV